MVIDDQGFAHVAAVLDSSGAIFHVTNSSGRWTRERISSPPQDTEDNSPAIAIDPADGSIWVTFSRRSSVSAPNFSEGVYVVLSRRGGSWGDEDALPFAGEDPKLLVEDGQLHVTYNDPQSIGAEDLNDATRPNYATNASGTWATASLADIGRAVAIHRSSRGPIVVLLSAWAGGDVDNAHAFIATQASSDQMAFELEQVPRVEGGGYSFEGGFGVNDMPFVSWHRSHDGNYRFKAQTGDGWTAARDGRAEAVDSLGGVHYLILEPLAGEGDGVELWYRTDRADGFGSRVIFAGSIGVWTTLTVDAQDRPHVFYSGAGSGYGIGPGY